MINIGGDTIINIIVNNSIINLGTFENNIIYKKNLTLSCRAKINTGDWSNFYFSINNKQYVPNIISKDDSIIVENNRITFMKSGNFNIIFNYKGYNITMNCNVINCELNLS